MIYSLVTDGPTADSASVIVLCFTVRICNPMSKGSVEGPPARCTDDLKKVAVLDWMREEEEWVLWRNLGF